MTRTIRWQSPIGRSTLNGIVKKLVPQWTAGLRPVQEDLVSAILDNDNILCCTATGDGKSCAFSIPILVLNEYNTNLAEYPAGLPTRLNPVGLVVTPTKGLAANIIAAFAYSRESLAEARRGGTNLADEIKNCEKWQVVCVDPEHLKTKEWRIISEAAVFRSRLLYAAADEVHLINEWGGDFRLDFRGIGPYFRGRLPTTISVVGLSATLAPGKDTTAVCRSLGFFDGQFQLLRRTNERPNIHFVMQTLTHGLAGYEFPDLLPFLRSGRKVIIHFHSPL
ncbi:P-loop containing nucleoside triphosphate hydrolase protein [Mycena filopes]|nr:P-loop containing nucleoside triphosphate hydrolase protein [Mycena filopes]